MLTELLLIVFLEQVLKEKQVISLLLQCDDIFVK
jgi:hypothetical protein